MKIHNYSWFFLFFIWFPVLLFFFSAATQKRKAFFHKFNRQITTHLLHVSEHKVWMKRILLFTALILLTIAAARPKIGSSELSVSSEGIDIAVVFDVSLSMLAEDEDGPRFEKGKRLLIDAVSELKGDRVSLIPFAGASFLMLPLTSDYNTIFSLIGELRPGIINSQGSSIASALELATESLKSGKENSDKLVVLISDGEDPNLDFGEMKALLEKNNINLAILPLGTAEGAPVQVGDSYLKDRRGEMVVSKLKKDFFEKCVASLDAMEIKKGETLATFISSFKNRVREEETLIQLYKEQFQIPLLGAILCFFLFAVLQTGRKEVRS